MRNPLIRNIVLATGLALSLAACQTTTQTAAPVATAPLSQKQLNADTFNFLWQSGTAVAVAGLCSNKGVRLKHGSSVGMARVYVEAKVKQGYSQQQISASLKSVNRSRAKDQGIAYLIARGAKKGQAATVCPIARKEVAAKTGVGQFLEVRG